MDAVPKTTSPSDAFAKAVDKNAVEVVCRMLFPTEKMSSQHVRSTIETATIKCLIRAQEHVDWCDTTKVDYCVSTQTGGSAHARTTILWAPTSRGPSTVLVEDINDGGVAGSEEWRNTHGVRATTVVALAAWLLAAVVAFRTRWAALDPKSRITVTTLPAASLACSSLNHDTLYTTFANIEIADYGGQPNVDKKHGLQLGSDEPTFTDADVCFEYMTERLKAWHLVRSIQDFVHPTCLTDVLSVDPNRSSVVGLCAEPVESHAAKVSDLRVVTLLRHVNNSKTGPVDGDEGTQERVWIVSRVRPASSAWFAKDRIEQLYYLTLEASDLTVLTKEPKVLLLAPPVEVVATSTAIPVV